MLYYVKPVDFYSLYEKENFDKFFFTHDRFFFLKNILPFLYVFILLILYVALYSEQRVVEHCLSIQHQISTYFKKSFTDFYLLGKGEKAMLFFLIIGTLLMRMFFVDLINMSDDEYWSYQYFVKQGFWVVTTYYPDTNNHILYNQICWLIMQVGIDPIYGMKVVPLLSNFFLLYIVFVFVNRKFGFKAAAYAIAFSSFMISSSFFSLIGRGHMIVALYAVILTLLVYLKWTRGSFRNFWIYYVILSSLALYTVPTYLIHFFVLSTFLLHLIWVERYKKEQYYYIVAHLSIVLVVFLCYLPVVLSGGLDVFLGSKWVVPKKSIDFFQQFHVYVAELIEYSFGVLSFISKAYFYIFMIYILMGVSLFNKRIPLDVKKWIALTFFIFVASLFFIVLMRVYPPYRIFTYYFVFFFMAMSILLQHHLNTYYNRYKFLFVGTVFVIIAFGIGFYLIHFNHIPI